MKRDKILLDLPILLHDRDSAAGSDDITDAFVSERDAVSSPDELHSFLGRWRSVWLLRHPSNDVLNFLTTDEEKMLSRDFDAAEVLSWMVRRKEENLPFDLAAVKVMANIVLPVPFLWAFELSARYGVGCDLGLVRLFLDPYPEYGAACRCGSGDPRTQTVKETMET